MRASVLISAAALALSACSTTTAPAPSAPAAPSASVAAPTPADVTIHIGAEHNGRVVQVPIGQRFAIELVGVPTAGYVWQPADIPEFITRVSEASGPTSQAQSQPGFAGGNHWEVLILAPLEAGRGDVVMIQRRPWETNEAPVQSFRVTIEAR